MNGSNILTKFGMNTTAWFSDNVSRETICWPIGNTGRKDNKMKVKMTDGETVELSALQTKLAIYCISLNGRGCDECKYDGPCTFEFFISLGNTPNGAIIPKNFNTRICTNNYRKLHNLPKKRKGVDYFD